MTDAELIYTPAQIALACLSIDAPNLAAEWARSKAAEDILDVIEKIKNMILTSGSVPAVDKVREVDRRLKLCKNPEKVPGTKAYLAKQAEEERIAAEKRAKKVQEVQRAMEGEDPFGSDIAQKARAVAALDDDDD